MVLALADIVPIETEPTLKGYSEGEIKRTEVNRYERNPLNRKLCVAANGYDCSICGFDFQKVYGELGNQFIHIHHITPVSKIGPGYMIDPIKDLTPVCPNCHAMLHRTDPPLQPEQLKMILMARTGKMLFSDFTQQYKVAEENIKYDIDTDK
ncbi:MAG TPA: hypothetical protein DCZ91_14890 [Lachnospiraceae bacterium]|nr:hypothetical protein [Lachnospiraceae bacterium]